MLRSTSITVIITVHRHLTNLSAKRLKVCSTWLPASPTLFGAATVCQLRPYPREIRKTLRMMNTITSPIISRIADDPTDHRSRCQQSFLGGRNLLTEKLNRTEFSAADKNRSSGFPSKLVSGPWMEKTRLNENFGKMMLSHLEVLGTATACRTLPPRAGALLSQLEILGTDPVLFFGNKLRPKTRSSFSSIL